MDTFLDRLTRAPGLPWVWRHAVSFYKRKGIGAISYYLLKPAEDVAAMTPLFHGPLEEVFRVYTSFDFRRLDIVPRTVMATGSPMRWSDIWANHKATPDQLAFLKALRATHHGDGLGLPCFGPQGFNSYVGLSYFSGGQFPHPSQWLILHTAAQAMHFSLCRIFAQELRPSRTLSRRETDVLKWVAMGKSNSVIAEILNLSNGTVDTYMRRIYDKMGVSDRTSAAVQAVSRGIIHGH